MGVEKRSVMPGLWLWRKQKPSPPGSGDGVGVTGVRLKVRDRDCSPPAGRGPGVEEMLVRGGSGNKKTPFILPKKRCGRRQGGILRDESL